MIGSTYLPTSGGGGGGKVLGTLSVPGRLTNLDNSRAKTYCTCGRCGIFFVFDIFFSRLSFFFLFPSLWETARYRLIYCLKGPLNPKQPPYLPGKKVLHAILLFVL